MGEDTFDLLPFVQSLISFVCCSDAMDKLGCKRFCCRRMIMTHVDLIEKLLKSVYPHSRRTRELIHRLGTIPRSVLG